MKGGDHAPKSKGKPLRCWEVKAWYSTILLDCRYPQSRPKPYSWREILSGQLHSDGLLQLLSASRCACPHVLLIHPHTLNIIFKGKKKKSFDEWLLGKHPPFPCKIFPMVHSTYRPLLSNSHQIGGRKKNFTGSHWSSQCWTVVIVLTEAYSKGYQG
jgi:hypothetical protein